MPVYEYRCSSGHAYEKTEGFSAPSRQQCQVCGATARRQISLPAVIFKGSGFYSTDNRKSSTRPGGDGSSTASEPAAATPGANGHSQDGTDGHSPGTEKPKVASKAD